MQGGGRLSAGATTVTSGGEVEFTGPPNATLEYKNAGEKEVRTVQLDDKGKGKIEFGGGARWVTVWVSDDLDSSVSIQVVEPTP